MFKTPILAIAIATMAATAASARPDWPLGHNTVSFNALIPNALNPNALNPNGLASNGLASNGLSQNALEAHAPLNGRVIGIELPPATDALH